MPPPVEKLTEVTITGYRIELTRRLCRPGHTFAYAV